MNQNSVAYMKEYLKYAIEFEKYVYVWQNAMNEANNRIRSIYDERKRLERAKFSAQNSVSGFGSGYDSRQRHNEKEAKRYKKKQKITLIVICLILFLFFGLGYVAAASASNDYGTFDLIKAAIGFAIFGGFFSGVIPVCIGVFFFFRSKYQHFAGKTAKGSSEASRRRQEIILNAKEQENDFALMDNSLAESEMNKLQEEISDSLIKAKNNLSNLYAQNILPMKYRSLNAVATLYEYLETGICNTIQGHGGIYDTYERDLRVGLIIQNLVEINSRLADIQEHQHMLYQELQKANMTLSDIRSSLANIEVTNAQIASNTAISAVANQQAATEIRYRNWRDWTEGK